MNRLYQWLFEQASSFHSNSSHRLSCRTVRTEVTVERKGITLLVGGVAAASFDTCPLCGGNLAPAQAEQLCGRLLRHSKSQEPDPPP